MFVLLGSGNLQAQTNLQIIKGNSKCATSYAVFVDSKTFEACKAEIMEYKKVLESEGLATYILAAQWNKPEEVKAQIQKLAKSKQTFEGMSFVGEVPIVRALKAQHMATALKMSEYTNPKEKTAVASDRYYDCTALQWKFVAQDEQNPNMFYYELEGEGAQHLYPDYYSARILVPEEFEKTVGIDKYELMRRFFKKAVEFAKANQILIVSDAAYAPLNFKGKPLSILSIPGAMDCAVELHSMSKGFNMTGWRLGWVCGNPLAVKAFATVKDNADSGQFLAIQKAAIAALDDQAAITPAISEKYERRLTSMVNTLQKLGFNAKVPAGSFYLYVKAPKASSDGTKFESGEDFSQWLIKTKLISSVPWDDVGPYVRFSATFVARGGKAEEDRVLAEFANRLADAKFEF
ncbi:MAG: aminotransferase class I/II-fold pyridoxal phosphate-dependent enzyme [Lentisphaeria bacterium]|nr:aminotransferase class I/II-fold pyridoxal phosphate-dependent enzyme [Lentisphaeria bacterium]